MTRTVEEALRDVFGYEPDLFVPDSPGAMLRDTIRTALREARDAALHEAASHLDRIAPYAEDQQTTFNAQGCAREVRLLASSPPPAAPARDDRGADGLDPETWARAIEAAAGLAEDSPGLLSTPAQKRLASQIRRLTPPAASSSGEANALRDPDARVKKGFRIGISAAARAVDSLAAHTSREDEEQRAWLHAYAEAAAAIRALAAPSQPEPFRLPELPVSFPVDPDVVALAAPSQETDAYRCSCRCHSEGRTCGWCAKRDPAPAPSAAPDTGKEPTP
jgi:hypothetical protein